MKTGFLGDFGKLRHLADDSSAPVFRGPHHYSYAVPLQEHALLFVVLARPLFRVGPTRFLPGRGILDSLDFPPQAFNLGRLKFVLSPVAFDLNVGLDPSCQVIGFQSV